MSLSMFDGPAEDQSFDCGRAPRLLRVVCSRAGKWDCLDLVDDEPKPTERIYLYEQIAYRGPIFVDGRTPGGGRRWGARYECADYAYVAAAIGDVDAACRSTAGWRAFVEAYFGVELLADGTVSNVVELRP